MLTRHPVCVLGSRSLVCSQYSQREPAAPTPQASLKRPCHTRRPQYRRTVQALNARAIYLGTEALHRLLSGSTRAIPPLFLDECLASIDLGLPASNDGPRVLSHFDHVPVSRWLFANFDYDCEGTYESTPFLYRKLCESGAQASFPGHC
jgi:hypothetical protein